MALVERDHLVEDAAVRVAVEIPRVDDLHGLIERVVVDEDGAEHRALGFEIVRKRAFRSSNNGVGHECGRQMRWSRNKTRRHSS